MVNGLYVIGGKQRMLRTIRAGNGNWDGYQQGVILQIDPSTGEWKERVSYISPPEVCPPEEPAITFQASTICNQHLYVCTQTEVLIYTLPEFEQIGYLSLPFFNDLHHVRPAPEGNIFVAVAGLEMVVELTMAGEVCRAWNVLGEEPWQLSSDVDFRKLNTKPHRSHPNYLFCIDSDLWVTRFHQGDALCLTDRDRRISISNERIHDGVVYNNRVYFTSVNGWIYVVNPSTLTVETVIDLNKIHPDGTLLG